MKMDIKTPTTMLAPCGMNCAVCYVHLRKKKPCMGCRSMDGSQPNHCRECKIKECAVSRGLDFCFECPSFPCASIKRLDKNYRQRYQVSLIENAVHVKSVGIEQYLLEEKQKWTCKGCGGVICLHDHICSECGRVLEKV